LAHWNSGELVSVTFICNKASVNSPRSFAIGEITQSQANVCVAHYPGHIRRLGPCSLYSSTSIRPCLIWNQNGSYLYALFCQRLMLSYRWMIQAFSPPQPVDDSYLMDLILKSKQFKPAQIRRLPLSDITSNTGLHLDLRKRNGSPSLYSSVVTQNVRVHQDRPS
jgi:hypothetical protein